MSTKYPSFYYGHNIVAYSEILRDTYTANRLTSAYWFAQIKNTMWIINDRLLINYKSVYYSSK